jgi:hypothetical protein
MYEALSSSAEIVAGVLGIAVTVVAIIVELAATRYNHRITDMFVRDPVNIGVLVLFVATTLACLWVIAFSSPDGSRVLHATIMVLISLSLLALLPYFAYVFAFISPIDIIARISGHAHAALHGTPNRTGLARAIDELQDVLRSSIDQRDRSIAMSAVDALADLVERYEGLPQALPDPWYCIDGALRLDPDFVSLETSALERIEQDRSWFEFKIFAQLHNAFALSLPRLRDVANLIAIRTRRLAVEVAADGSPLQHLCLTAYNSFLRASINARDPRASYYVLSQYRQVIEALLARRRTNAAELFARRVKFYGQLAFDSDQAFLLEVCAYDLVALMEHCELPAQVATLAALVDALVDLDREITAQEEPSLLGVRRAQVKGAVLLLALGEEALARRITDDLASETPERIATLIAGLEADDEPHYWELSPRGVNFAYLEPAHRPLLANVAQLVADARTASSP